MLSKAKLALIAVIVVAAVSGLLLMTSHPGAPAANEKIEIPAGGAKVSYGSNFTAKGQSVYWNSASVTVHNIGSVPVEIITISVQSVAYSYSPTATPGKFSADSNQIAPGQTVSFTITPTTPVFVAEQTNISFKVVTSNGAEADATVNYF